VISAERVALCGLTLVARRRVAMARSPGAAHEVFLREARPRTTRQQRAVSCAQSRAHGGRRGTRAQARREDVLVDEDAIGAFYAERIPASIHSAAGFERWRIAAESREPRLLYMTREVLMRHAAASIAAVQYPEFVVWPAPAAAEVPLFPGHPLDGLTLVPLPLLNQLDAARLSWLVPGMVREKLTWYLKAMPKAWRNRLTPVPEVVTSMLEFVANEAGGETRDVAEALRSYCAARLDTSIPADVWAGVVMPAHLQVNIRVVDANGTELAQGRDLAQLRTQLGQAAQLSFAAVGPAVERRGITRWDWRSAGIALLRARWPPCDRLPTLVDEGESVALTLYDTKSRRGSRHARGRRPADSD
jgi:ATP-dependent helicase HrpA